MKRTALLAVLPMLLIPLAGCGDDDKPTSKQESAGLDNADDVIASQDAEAASKATFGEFADLGDGLRARVDTPTLGGDDLGPWITIKVRIENTGKEESSVPEPSIACASSTEPGGYQADSTLFSGEPIPAGSFKEGTFNVLLPEDGRSGDPAKDCVGDAYLELASLVGDGTGRWALPGQLIEQVNAKNKG